ncbi:hypothetical protein WR25_12353 [Diploscapter pachys]|uniref:Glycoside hydrolase 35 catalytic domain-containing protein n=1 Tax=Diploscapter pachys TaxID=2018661 RepID=A0A2A2LBQ0_9BILA|nr:hypothetical protein WR25_12353 [Diploscapter pachys]
MVIFHGIVNFRRKVIINDVVDFLRMVAIRWSDTTWSVSGWSFDGFLRELVDGSDARLIYFATMMVMADSVSALATTATSESKTSFEIDYTNNQFLLDGEPFRYISGSIHYFRIHPSLWRDRLYRVRALGFNAIQYYIPWNFHEIQEGQYDFSGWRDFVNFTQTAHELGMWTLLRIGPYICGEWENGGLPYWLMNKAENIKMRSADRDFTTAVLKWFRVLLPKVKPLMRNNGGPADPEWSLKCGYTPGTYPTIDFGPDTPEMINHYFEMQMKYAVRGPLVNSEFYAGWFTRWGVRNQTLPSTASIIKSIQHMYDVGANFNFYMIHGGTNFGFWNGAEPQGPVITSYDYFAPISEAGDITEKYLAIRDFISGIPDWKNKPLPVPKNSKKKAYGKIKLNRPRNSIRDMFGKHSDRKGCITSKYPPNAEKLNGSLGFIAYETTVQNACGTLSIPKFKDFAYVITSDTNGRGERYEGTLTYSFNGVQKHELNITKCRNGTQQLVILVENQGRQNWETINDHKGIIGDVYLNGQKVTNWNSCAPWINFPYEINTEEKSQEKSALKPITLYVPAALLKKGTNQLEFIEFERQPKSCMKENKCFITFVDKPIWNFENVTETDQIDQRMFRRKHQYRI